MQQIKVLAMGKAGAFYADGIREYAKRLGPLCRFEAAELSEEVLDEKKASPAQIEAALEKEGARLLAAVPKGALLVALCVEGKLQTTEAFAAMLEDAALRGTSAVVFVIGSSWGLAPAVKTAATHKLSLSQMTLPHQLARLVLVEQIYRALMIRGGSRYHK